MENLKWSKLTISNDISYLHMALLYVQESAKLVGFNDTETKEIMLAAEEGIANVIEHAYTQEENETFDIICKQVPLGIQIIIKEKGMPFDPEQIPKYEPTATLSNQTGNGLGLFLMKKVMDELSFHNLGINGKETHLTKYLSFKDITRIVDLSELTYFEKEEKVIPKKNVKFIIQDIKPEQAIEVSKCFYKTYGYTYYYEHIYYPEKIIALNRSGHLITAIAKADDNKFAGFCALSKDEIDDNIAEIAQAVVKPEYRGNKCFELLIDYLILQAKSKNISGIYGQIVTNHIYSQKALHRIGFKDCAIELGYLPATMVFKKITEGLVQRETALLSFLPLQKTHNIKLYVPAHHKGMIEKIYKNIGINPYFEQISKEETDFSDSSAVIKTKIQNLANNALIKVEKYGNDVLLRIKEQLKDLCLKHIDTIYLHLNLEDSLTAILTQDFENMGFFFCGILPGESNGDSLILQYLNNVSIDSDKIQLHNDFSKELLMYIKESMQNDPKSRLTYWQ